MTSEPPDYRRSRTSLKNEHVANDGALGELMETLITLGPSRWEQFGVAEPVQNALRDGALIDHPSARARHLKHVRAMLRGYDWHAILRRIEQWRAGAPLEPIDAPVGPHVSIATDLIIQGDSGLARFIAEYPESDRTRLRQLIKNAHSAGDGKRARARSLLEQSVERILAEAAQKEATRQAAVARAAEAEALALEPGSPAPQDGPQDE